MTPQMRRNQTLLQKLLESLGKELQKDEDLFYEEHPWILTHEKAIPDVKVSSLRLGVQKNIRWLLERIDILLPQKEEPPTSAESFPLWLL